MDVSTLSELYTKLCSMPATIYVAPKINYENPDSDYLFNLYKTVTDNEPQAQIKSLTAFTHFKPFFAALFNDDVIFHYHWLEFQDAKSLLGMPWKIFWLTMYHLIGGKLVWTIHNEQPHDYKLLKLHRYLHKKMAKHAIVIHVHCKTAARLMSKKLKVSLNRFFVIQHPYFPSVQMDKEQAVAGLNNGYELDINPQMPLALIFGQISHYKYIEEVLANFIGEKQNKIQFLIAGTVKKGNQELAKRLEELAARNGCIKLITRFIPDKDLPFLFNAADVCVFNYKRILTSGGVYMALSYNIPIIAPNLGCVAELRTHRLVQLFDTGERRTELVNALAKA